MSTGASLYRTCEKKMERRESEVDGTGSERRTGSHLNIHLRVSSLGRLEVSWQWNLIDRQWRIILLVALLLCWIAESCNKRGSQLRGAGMQLRRLTLVPKDLSEGMEEGETLLSTSKSIQPERRGSIVSSYVRRPG